MAHLKAKYLIAFLFFISYGYAAKAQFYPNTYRSQSDWQINVGIEGLYSYNPATKPGLGGTVGVQYFINDMISGRASVGYKMINDLRRKDEFKYIPAQLGVKAYLTPSVYVSGDAGFVSSNKVLANRANLWLIVSPGIGYSSQTNGFDASLIYDVLHRSNDYVAVFGLRLSYSFNLSSY